MPMPVDLLDSDIALYELHTVKERNPDGSISASLRMELHPDGWDVQQIKGRLVGDNLRQLVVAWHNHVRNQINAWENRQETEALKRAEASRASRERQDAAPPVVERSPESSPIYLPDGEASLEAILEAKVAALSRSVASIEATIAETDAALKLLRERRTALLSDSKRAARGLLAVTTGRVRKKRNASSSVRGKGVQRPGGAVEDSGRPAVPSDSSNSRGRKRGRPAGGGLGTGARDTGGPVSG